MNAEKYLESEFVTVDYAKTCGKDRLMLLSAGVDEKYQEKSFMKFLVEIAGKQKFLRMNKKTVDYCIKAFGAETEAWVGKWLEIKVEVAQNGREMVVGYPLLVPFTNGKLKAEKVATTDKV